jgi:hypothetical protein
VPAVVVGSRLYPLAFGYKPRGRWSLLVAAMALCSPPVAADADGAGPAAASDAGRAEAERHFQRGRELARGLSWDAALAEFVVSRELYPTRSATRNAAIALEHLGRFAESYRMYEALFRDFSVTTPQEQLAAWRAEMALVAARTAELVVAPSQPQVSVFIDGRPYGTTPLDAPIRVSAGTHAVRLEKVGFEPLESVQTIAGGQRKLLTPRLRPLTDSGVLAVREVSGAKLTVLVDGVAVGATPWTGRVGPGDHYVELRGDGMLGTPPSSAAVRGATTTTLALRATVLDAELRVEPVPSNASLYVDGVAVGAGAWKGRLPSGLHRVEATAAGHYAVRRDVRLEPRGSLSLTVPLERDTSSPFWRTARRSNITLGLAAGGLFGASLHGDAHADGVPWVRGAGAAARFGYDLAPGLALELGARFVSLWQPLTRDLKIREPELTWTSNDYQDTTRLLGGGVSLGASYRAFHRYPVVTRLAVGVLGLASRTTNDATFRAAGVERRVSVAERGELLAVPFAESELRVGYRLSERWVVDVGLGLLVLVPPKKWRSDADSPAGVDRPREIGLRDEEDGRRLGGITLPREVLARPFAVLSPTLGLRCEL